MYKLVSNNHTRRKHRDPNLPVPHELLYLMEKAIKWLRNLLKKKKKKKKHGDSMTASAAVSLPATKEKMRWSFRRSVGSAKDLNSPEPSVSTPSQGLFEKEIDQKKHAAAAVVRLTDITNGRTLRAMKEVAAIKIQSVFRSYLARKALGALKGLVKLQALVRGYLVRKQAIATLRCMQALINSQVRARAKRIGIVEESQRQHNYRRSPQHPQFRQTFEMDRDDEVYIKIVEMDIGETRSNSKNSSSHSIQQYEKADQKLSTYNSASCTPTKQVSPAPSTLTDMNTMSPIAYGGNYGKFLFAAEQSSPHLSAMSMPAQNCFDYSLHPNYMANTESSRAKARSQSAPKQRLDSHDRQSSRRRTSVEGRNIPRAVRMQRSSSHAGLTDDSYQYPWSIKFDKSNMSLKDSECGSTSTVLTSLYCRSLLGKEIHANNY